MGHQLSLVHIDIKSWWQRWLAKLWKIAVSNSGRIFKIG